VNLERDGRAHAQATTSHTLAVASRFLGWLQHVALDTRPPTLHAVLDGSLVSGFVAFGADVRCAQLGYPWGGCMCAAVLLCCSPQFARQKKPSSLAAEVDDVVRILSFLLSVTGDGHIKSLQVC
jgi:hypothetical protein